MPNMPFRIHFSILELEGILKITVQTTTLQMMTQKVNISEIGKTKTLIQIRILQFLLKK